MPPKTDTTPLVIQLPEAERQKLEALAAQQKKSVQEVASKYLSDRLSIESDLSPEAAHFRQVLESVLTKHAEAFKKLADS